ncbi:DegV family protein [Paenibacillus sp. strain BS8-2]
MPYQIVVDSCCDLTEELKNDLKIRTVPLNLSLGDKHYVDDDTLEIPTFIEDMHRCTEKIGSSAPSPALYQQEYEGHDQSFVVTLSSKLSSSYNSALLGAQMLDDASGKVHVFDSKSAAAGELLIAMQIHELIQNGYSADEIVERIERFIMEMKTYFVLDNIDNLLKNGRLGKIKGKLINFLNIKPLLGSDGDGNITHYSNCKGQINIVKKMAATVKESGKDTKLLRAVISHCNNPVLAERLKQELELQFSFKEIIIVPTRGVSTMYANDKGVILAY